MKTVFTNQELFHVYASGAQESGRSANGNVYFNGATIYSYGSHFPMAHRYGEKYLVTNESYSVTTSKHMSHLCYALHHCETVTLPALGVVLDLLRMKKRAKDKLYGQYDKQELPRQCASYCNGMAREINDLRGKLSRARAEWRKNQIQHEIELHESAARFVWHEIAGRKSDPISGAVKQDKKARKQRLLASISQELENSQQGALNAKARKYALDILKMRKNLIQRSEDAEYILARIINAAESAQSAISRSIVSINAGNREFVTKAAQRDIDAINAAKQSAYERYIFPIHKRARTEYDKLRDMSDAEKIEQFHARKIHSAATRQVVCRVNGDIVETSRGARVPLNDAIMLFKAAHKCKQSGKQFVNDPARKQVSLGMYRLNKIDAHGNATIGCHYLTWDAIQDCARRYMPELLGNMVEA